MPLRIVQPGMMIDQAIIDRAGRVLIARRTRLEDFHIDALKKMGVTGIYTCEGGCGQAAGTAGTITEKI